MIEFYGELSEKSKQYLLKENSLIGLLAGIFIVIVFGTVTVVIAQIFNLWILLWIIPFYVLVALIAMFAPYLQKKKTLSLLIPKKISIDEENIYYDLEKISEYKPLYSVKRVFDYGDLYLIKFYFPRVSGYVCEKSLIKQGSIEEFEKIFEGKIERKKH